MTDIKVNKEYVYMYVKGYKFPTILHSDVFNKLTCQD